MKEGADVGALFLPTTCASRSEVHRAEDESEIASRRPDGRSLRRLDRLPIENDARLRLAFSPRGHLKLTHGAEAEVRREEPRHSTFEIASSAPFVLIIVS
jgi:hypothetical protein